MVTSEVKSMKEIDPEQFEAQVHSLALVIANGREVRVGEYFTWMHPLNVQGNTSGSTGPITEEVLTAAKDRAKVYRPNSSRLRKQ